MAGCKAPINEMKLIIPRVLMLQGTSSPGPWSPGPDTPVLLSATRPKPADGQKEEAPQASDPQAHKEEILAIEKELMKFLQTP